MFTEIARVRLAQVTNKTEIVSAFAGVIARSLLTDALAEF
jgi:hypothetical protein